MRIVTAIAALVALGGCEKASTKAVREAEMVERTNDKAAICQANRKAAAAFLSDGDEGKYKQWKLKADVSCLSADLGG